MRRHLSRRKRQSAIIASRRLDRLSETVSDLFIKATENEKILNRYQRFELQLLDVAGFGALLDMLIRNSVEYFQLQGAELWLYDPQSTLSELLPEHYLHTSQLRLLSSADELIGLYGSRPTVRLVSDEVGALPIFVGHRMRSCALLPLVRHGVLVGSLHFGVNNSERFAQDKSTDFITHLASIVAVCLENAVNQDRLHRLSMYDMLTQVKNRRAFQLALNNEVSRAARNGDPLSLLFIDLDHFKAINDQYGHPMGDRVLKEVAQHIHQMLRKTDHVCRYGGEEFALVLPNCAQQRAMEIAERIRQQISELIISDDKGVSVTLTVSIGVSGWFDIATVHEMDTAADIAVASELVRCADKSVYFAKAQGRNSIHFIGMDCGQARTSCLHALDDSDTMYCDGAAWSGSVGEAVNPPKSTHLDTRRNDVWPEMIL